MAYPRHKNQQILVCLSLVTWVDAHEGWLLRWGRGAAALNPRDAVLLADKTMVYVPPCLGSVGRDPRAFGLGDGPWGLLRLTHPTWNK